MTGPTDPWRPRRQTCTRARAGSTFGAALAALLGLVDGLTAAAGDLWTVGFLSAALIVLIAGIGFGAWEDRS